MTIIQPHLNVFPDPEFCGKKTNTIDFISCDHCDCGLCMIFHNRADIKSTNRLIWKTTKKNSYWTKHEKCKEEYRKSTTDTEPNA